jgi:hypothetical protein
MPARQNDNQICQAQQVQGLYTDAPYKSRVSNGSVSRDAQVDQSMGLAAPSSNSCGYRYRARLIDW